MQEKTFEEHMHEIVSFVWNFVDEIIANHIDSKILEEHGLSSFVIDTLKTSNHVSKNICRNRVFRHLMKSIGYYDILYNGNIYKLSINEVEKRLYRPHLWAEFKKTTMEDYQLITGVKESLSSIQETLGEKVSCKGIGTIVPAKNNFLKKDDGYEISFSLPYNKSLNENFNISLEQTPFYIGEQAFVIQKNGCYISTWVRNFVKDDDISICLTHFNSECLDSEKEYYQRYITEIKDYDSIIRNIKMELVCLDGYNANGMFFQIEKTSFALYFFKDGEKSYMAIDSNCMITEKCMKDVAFSVSISIGLLTGNLFLGEYWMVSSIDESNRTPIGIFYSSLTSSVRSNYSLFTTNVYSVLVPIAKNIDSKNGEKRAIEIIESYKLYTAIPPVSIEVFEKLIQNFDRYESLQRGIYILLIGSHYPLEFQAGAFAIALETISNISKQIINNNGKKLNDIAWKFIHKELKELAENHFEKGEITLDEKDFLLKKFDHLNNGFNSDKLSSLLLYYEYPLTNLDNEAIKYRNTFLHGNINIKKMKGSDFDKLLQVSLILHKLCSSIPLLMAGYKGYIINNCKLYGYKNTGKTFLKIGDTKIK